MHLRPEGRACRLVVAVAVAGAGGMFVVRRARRRSKTAARRPSAPAAASVPHRARSGAEPAPKPLPGVENAGKPGYYTVKPGDTLMRIALDNGQNWRDVARWNNLENPNLVEVGQVLRVVPPARRPDRGDDAGRAEHRRASTARPLDSRPRRGSRLAPHRGRLARGAARPPPGAAAACGAARRRRPPTPPAAADAARPRAMPTTTSPGSGRQPAPVVAGFDEGRNKGLTITGKAGDPVLAAGDGRVVYAGSSLRGYGNLVIVKHNDTLPHRLRAQPGAAGQGRPGRAPRPEDRRDGLQRRRARATALRDPAPGQADRSGQAAAAALAAPLAGRVRGEPAQLVLHQQAGVCSAFPPGVGVGHSPLASRVVQAAPLAAVQFVQLIISGSAQGCIYGLIALGFVLI